MFLQNIQYIFFCRTSRRLSCKIDSRYMKERSLNVSSHCLTFSVYYVYLVCFFQSILMLLLTYSFFSGPQPRFLFCHTSVPLFALILASLVVNYWFESLSQAWVWRGHTRMERWTTRISSRRWREILEKVREGRMIVHFIFILTSKNKATQCFEVEVVTFCVQTSIVSFVFPSASLHIAFIPLRQINSMDC